MTESKSFLNASDDAKAQRTAPLYPPVHLWDPPYCADIGLAIDHNGVWSQNGVPIRRPEIVRLFASILRRDPDGHVLVTPNEKVRVSVADAPFLAVEMAIEAEARGQRLRFRTNLGDWTTVNREHPLRFESGVNGGFKPYLKVRDDLWALVGRAVVWNLIEVSEVREIDGARIFGISSDGVFFPVGPTQDVELTQ